MWLNPFVWRVCHFCKAKTEDQSRRQLRKMWLGKNLCQRSSCRMLIVGVMIILYSLRVLGKTHNRVSEDGMIIDIYIERQGVYNHESQARRELCEEIQKE